MAEIDHVAGPLHLENREICPKDLCHHSLLELWHPSGARVVCTTEYASLSNYIHVLDAFVKDSKEGKKIRPRVKDRIERRARDLKQRMDDLKKFNRQMSMVRSKAH